MTARPFPLPLTVLEEFMLLDQPYPMDMWFEIVFSSPLSRSGIAEAVAAIQARHPMLTAMIEEHGDERCWVPGSGEIGVVHLEEGTPWPDLPLDPAGGVGARFYVSGNRVYLNLHHACSDGSGGRVVILELFIAYARATAPGGDWPRLPRLDPSRLTQRGRVEVATMPAAPPGTWKVLRDMASFLFPFPEALAPSPGSGQRPPFSRRLLDTDASAQILERAAHSEGGTLHDKAISDLFGTLAAWQISHGKSTGRLRLLIPWDLRGMADRRMPVCNRVTFAFLTRKVSECGPDLSASLHGEHEYIRRYRTDLDFLRGLELARQLGILPWILRSPASLSTAVFTEMGDVTSFRGLQATPDGLVVGDTICRHVSGVSSVRRGTRIAVCLTRMGARLAVAVRGDREYMGQEAEEALVEDFTRRLMEGGTPTPG